MGESMPVCEKCGAPAIIHISSEAAPHGTVRHFCMRCAALEESKTLSRRPGLNGAAVLIVVGLFTALLCVFADQLEFGRGEGFGWKQLTGLWIGVVLVVVGAFMRIATALVIGLIFGLLTVLADWLQLGGREGFGGRQMCGTVLGVGLIVAGLALARGRRTPPTSNGGHGTEKPQP